MATIQNLTVDQDADFTQTLTIKDSTGTVVDISGQTVTSKMRKTHLSTSATSFTTAIVVVLAALVLSHSQTTERLLWTKVGMCGV